MANMSDTLEDLASKQVANIPVGLMPIIFACDALSTLYFETCNKLERVAMKDAKEPMGKMMRGIVTAGEAGLGAWLLGNYADDLIGRKTANIASAIVGARGMDNAIGEFLVSGKGEKAVSVTERLAEWVRNFGLETTDSKALGIDARTAEAPAAPAAETPGVPGYASNFGSYSFLPEPIGYMKDYLPELPSRERKVDIAAMMG